MHFKLNKVFRKNKAYYLFFKDHSPLTNNFFQLCFTAIYNFAFNLHFTNSFLQISRGIAFN